MSKAVPAIPPLSSVQDRNTRLVLQAMIDGQRVRNGDVGEGGERFITANEIQDALSGKASLVQRGDGSISTLGSARTKLSDAIDSLLQRIDDSIMQSRLYKLLRERLEWIDTPEWFKGKFGAEFRDERIKIETANAALASGVRTSMAHIAGNLAMAREELTAASDLAGASAQAVTTLQTKVAGVQAIAEQAFKLSSSIEGDVEASWSVKVDTKGYVSGFGFGVDARSGGYNSRFGVSANSFFIAAPLGGGYVERVPFKVYATPTVINGVTVQPGVYMDTAVIANGSIGTAQIGTAVITNAKIQDAAVDTLSIAGNAITIPLFVRGSSPHLHPANTAPHDELSVSGYFPVACKVVLLAAVQANNPGDATNVVIRVAIDASSIPLHQSNSTNGGWVTQHTAFDTATVDKGWHTFKLQLGNDWNNGSGWFAQNMSLMVLGVAR